MATPPPPPPPTNSIDPKSGYSAATKTFYSTRPSAVLPSPDLPLSVTAFAFSLLPNPLPHHPAFLSFPSSAALSFPALISRTQSLAAAFSGEDFSYALPSGAVAFVLASSPHSIEIPPLFLALLSLGVAVSPANPASTPEEIRHQISLSKPAVAFATADVAGNIPPGAIPRVVLIDSAEFRSFLSGGGSQPPPPSRKVKQSDTAAILYSSGTTGRVKGVVLTHRNFIFLLANLQAMAAAPSPAVALFTVPLFHVFGFLMLLRSVALGEKAVLMEWKRFHLGAMMEAVARHRVTMIPAAPPVLVAMLKAEEEAARWDLSSMEVVLIGGAPLGRDVGEAFTARFPGVQVAQGYGLTETTGTAAVTAGEEERQMIGSVGRLATGLEARIVDPSTAEPLMPGQTGELWLRGDLVMKGYLGNTSATASSVTSDGWLKTGDLCYFNEDGFLFIVGRLKELIKYKGYQVPPAELELILQSHPQIADAAVIPYPDDEAGEIPMAFVVPQPGSRTVTEEQVKEFVAKQVAPYKRIRRVAFANAIPKSQAGKVLRQQLVKQALSMTQPSKL